MKVLVTGGAGYIGSHIVYELCDQKIDVIIYDNLSLGTKENVDPRAEFVEGDINDSKRLKEAMIRGVDVVFHFAAWKAAGESMENPMKYAHNNITGTLNLLNTMVEYGIKYFVFSSSAAVYGSPQYLPIDEHHPKNPENYYGYTKLAIEENLHWYAKLKGLNFAALRYFNATGYDIKGRIKGREKNPANLSPLVMEAASGMREKLLVFGDDYDTKDGTCIRDYIHVNDLAEAHLLAMDYLLNKDKSLVVNLGAGSGNSVIEVINAAAKVVGKDIPYSIIGRRAGDPAKLVAASQLAKDTIQWTAKYSDLETIFSSMKSIYSL
jgi:UDP-glucose 4-epimerase